MSFDPFEDIRKAQEGIQEATEEAKADFRAFALLARSKAGKRVLAALKRLVDYDGPVAVVNPDTGAVDIHQMLLRDGFRSCISVIEKNAALAESEALRKRGDA